MAKIMYGSMAGAVSGALGNTVFSHNRGGAYTRMRVIPTKTSNVYTIGVRNALSSASRGWGALTTDQQQAWNTWAQSNPITDRLGQKQVLFGNAAYVQLNSLLIQAGDTVISLPPAVAAPSAATALSFVADASDHTFTLTTAPTPLAAGLRFLVWVAILNGPGRGFWKNALKLVKISAKAQATGLDVGSEVEARFGSLIEGQKAYCQVQILDTATGLVSGPLLASALVQA